MGRVRPESPSSQQRYALQGSYLFYFRDAGAAKCQGVIPLEGACVEAAHGGKGAGEPRIRVSLEPDPALRHTSYMLGAENGDMQAWRLRLLHSRVWERCQPAAHRLSSSCDNLARPNTFLATQNQYMQAEVPSPDVPRVYTAIEQTPG